MIKALSIIIDSEVTPAKLLRQSAFNAASHFLQSSIPYQAISIGNKLIDIGHKYPLEVVDITLPLTNHGQPWTRIAALATITVADPTPYTLSELMALVSELPILSKRIQTKPTGQIGFDFGGWPTKQLDTLYAFIVREILQRLPPEDAGNLLMPILTPNFHGSASGQDEILKILHKYNRPDLAMPIEDDIKERYEKMISLGADYIDNTIGFINALNYLLPEPDFSELCKEGSILWHLSGFLKAINFWNQTSSNIWPDQILPEDLSIQEVLRGCVIASGVNPLLLSKDVASVLKLHNDQNEDRFSSLLYRKTEEVDIELEWKLAKGMDVKRLETALHYSTNWIVISAANLLEVNATPEELASIVVRVFEIGQDNALWVASQLCLILEDPIKSNILFERLEKTLKPGCQHLYDALAQLTISLDDRLLNILRNGLLTSGPLTARAAAVIAGNYANSPGIAMLLQEAFDLWCKKEDPYPVGSGRVPDSPREEILRGLLKQANFDKLHLLRYSTDARTDVAMVASQALFQVLNNGFLRDELLDGIDSGEIKSDLLAKALKQNVTFNKSQVNTICSFLTRTLTDLRKNSMFILRNEYLSTEEQQRHLKVLLNDQNSEIQEYARRLLNDD